MAVCSNAEDVVSLSLNAFHRLMSRFHVDPHSIGRIEVGSESNPDRAKSIKSHLMALMGPGSISGGDHVQACYGGTAALLNAAAWLESCQWETGKFAVVVAADVAVYPSGGARATGGAGSVALLLARSANLLHLPIKLEKCFGHHSAHIYDFYKPDPSTEFPMLDGPLSVSAYLHSALHAFTDWKRKQSEDDVSISNHFNQLIFHSPYSKIVYKAFCQLHQLVPNSPLKIKDTTQLDPETKNQINSDFDKMVKGNLHLSRNLGNSYCAAIFFNLIGSLLSESEKPSRIGVFSYGSGSMASFFSLLLDPEPAASLWIQSLRSDIHKRLADRIKISPIEYEALMDRKIQNYGATNFNASEIDLKDLPHGTFYLHQIDSNFRRIYKQK